MDSGATAWFCSQPGLGESVNLGGFLDVSIMVLTWGPQE
jgi:hypothetical protein